MEVSAIADVLKNVLPLHERRHPDPGPAVSAHMRKECVAAAEVLKTRGHSVTADPTPGDLAFQQKRGPVMRAAGAKIRCARADFLALARCIFSDGIEALGDGTRG